MDTHKQIYFAMYQEPRAIELLVDAGVAIKEGGKGESGVPGNHLFYTLQHEGAPMQKGKVRVIQWFVVPNLERPLDNELVVVALEAARAAAGGEPIVFGKDQARRFSGYTQYTAWQCNLQRPIWLRGIDYPVPLAWWEGSEGKMIVSVLTSLWGQELVTRFLWELFTREFLLIAPQPELITRHLAPLGAVSLEDLIVPKEAAPRVVEVLERAKANWESESLVARCPMCRKRFRVSKRESERAFLGESFFCSVACHPCYRR